MDRNKNERLFWTIFRNLYLNKIIFEKIKCKSRLLCYSYDKIIFSEWMIINNYLELLKYKVTRGDKLIFNNTWVNVFYNYEKLTRNQPESLNSSNSRFKYDQLEDDYSLITSKKGIYEVNSIFNWFKDDYDFYLNLFKNYSDYFKVNNCNNNNNKDEDEDQENKKIKKLPMCQSESRTAVHPLSLKQIINHIIVFDNVSAMKVLVEQGYYIRDDEQIFKDFIKSLEIGSLKLAEFIYNNYLNLEFTKEKEKIQSLWDLAIFTETNFIDIQKEDGLELFLNKFYLMKKLKNNNNNNNNKIILNCGEIIFKRIQSILRINIFKIKFNILIGYAEVISILNGQFDFQNNIIKNYKANTNYKDINEGLEEDKNEISILSIKEINELKLKLIEKNIINETKPLNQFDWNSLKQHLEGLYKMLIIFTGFSIPENYFIFKLKFNNKILNFKPMHFITNNPNDYFLYNLKDGGKQLIYNPIFSNYKNEKIQIKSFLENSLLDLNLRNDKLQSNKLFALTIIDNQYDDYEIIEYGINNLLFKGELPIDYNSFKNIKSIETFDFIFKSIQLKYPNNPSTNILSSIIDNFELATHFKENYPNQYKSSLKTIILSDISEFKNFTQLKFITHNWLDFKNIIIKSKGKNWVQDIVRYKKEFNINEFKTFVSCFDNLQNTNTRNHNDVKEDDDDNDDNDDNDNKSLYYANDLEESFYVYQNRSEHLKSGICEPIKIEFMNTINYINGEFDFSSLNFENEIKYGNLFEYIVQRCDFNAIDQIISILGQPCEDEIDLDYTNLDVIIHILSRRAFENGNTIVFDYLQNKSGKGFIETDDCYPW
ncbi:hypothetical protein ACTFIY_001413 [Dictyostelium cf. discoideum]